MVDAVTCYEKKVAFVAHLHAFTKPNQLLQKPIRNVLKKIQIHLFPRLMTGDKVLDPDIGGWIGECDEEIKGQALSAHVVAQ